jgi:hypothetical protein
VTGRTRNALEAPARPRCELKPAARSRAPEVAGTLWQSRSTAPSTATTAEYLYDYAAQDPVNGYDLDGTVRRPTRGDWANLISILTGAGVVTKPTPKPEPKGKPPIVQPNPQPKPKPPGGVVLPSPGDKGDGKGGDESGSEEGSGDSKSGGADKEARSSFSPFAPWLRPVFSPVITIRRPWVLPVSGGRASLRWP